MEWQCLTLDGRLSRPLAGGSREKTRAVRLRQVSALGAWPRGAIVERVSALLAQARRSGQARCPAPLLVPHEPSSGAQCGDDAREHHACRKEEQRGPVALVPLR